MYYSLGCGCGLILAGILVAGKLHRKVSFVPPDFFEQRYGSSRWIRLWAWASNVPSLLGIFIAQLLACGSILSAFGIPFYTGVIICSLVILVYSTLGGLWGIVIADSIQTTIIIISIPLIFLSSLLLLKTNNIDPFTLFKRPYIPPGAITKFIYLVIPFLVAISVSYDAYLKYQAARNRSVAIWGCKSAGILVIVIGILASSVGAADCTWGNIFKRSLQQVPSPGIKS
jgi:SSS family solute:Na+ symporter